jgi:hypothetical protein
MTVGRTAGACESHFDDSRPEGACLLIPVENAFSNEDPTQSLDDGHILW